MMTPLDKKQVSRCLSKMPYKKDKKHFLVLMLKFITKNLGEEVYQKVNQAL